MGAEHRHERRQRVENQGGSASRHWASGASDVRDCRPWIRHVPCPARRTVQHVMRQCITRYHFARAFPSYCQITVHSTTIVSGKLVCYLRLPSAPPTV